MTDKNTKKEPEKNEQADKIEALPEQQISEAEAQAVKGGLTPIYVKIAR